VYRSLFFLLTIFFVSLGVNLFLWFYYPQKQEVFFETELAVIEELPRVRAAAASTPTLELSAAAAYVVDLTSMTVLYEKNPDQILYPASTSKMMTALVAMDNYSLDQKLTVATEAATVNGTKLFFLQGQQISVADLLAALLIYSANDSAYILANHHLLGYAGFIHAMNQKALALGLTHTTFSNPAGLDELGQQSTARELNLLARELLKQPYLRELVATPDKKITNLEQGGSYDLHNTNQLLEQIRGVKGVKTGTTELAGEVLITLIEREGKQILISLLRSENRYADTSRLLAWIFNNYEWQKLEENEYNKF
jgi:serine-type D-Ala-D-Ala carboxypeptidase (penicillin-binding protein 5/6)